MANGREAPVSLRDVAPLGIDVNVIALIWQRVIMILFLVMVLVLVFEIRPQNLRAQNLLSGKPVTIILFLSLTTLCLLFPNLLVPDVQVVLVILPNALRMILTTFVNVKLC